MAAPPNAAQLLRAAFSRRGFSLPDDGGASAVSAKLVALMSSSENDAAACKGSNNSAADGLARQFEAYAMATGIAPSELTPALVEAFEREARASAATKRSAQAAVGAGLSWDDAADALADGTNVRLPRMGGSQKEAGGKQRSTRSAAAAVRAAHAAATATTAAADAAPSPSAAATPAGNASGLRHEATPGSAFSRRERSGEVVASLRPEIELPDVEARATKKKALPSAMDVDGGNDALDAEEAAASAAAALDELPVAAKRVELLCPGPAPSSRIMTDSLADRAAYVESRVERFAASFERLASAGAPPAERDGGADGGDPASLGSAPRAPVGVARQTANGLFVGRVVDSLGGVSAASGDESGDATAPPQRLDLHSASLEGSAATSGGRRAKLDVSSLGHRWRLFPGQVVAVAGACPAGHTLVASALMPSAPPPRAPPREASAPSGAGGDAGLKVVVAAGPFSAPGDVAFEALDAVLSLAEGTPSSPRPADAVVLVGPFVDERHPAVSSGSLDVSFDDVFERGVVARLSAWSDEWTRKKKTRNSPPPTVALLPSPRDVAAGALTSAFPSKLLELPRGAPANVVSLPNPATFRVGDGLVFGATGHDVLRDLSASQAAGGLGDGGGRATGVAPKDRLAGLAGALVEQGSYYPLYPPARGAMLDARLATPSPSSRGLEMPYAPDVLLLPSDLAPFARVASAERPPPSLRVDESGELVSPPSASSAVPPPGPAVESVAVNPGRAVTAGGGGGTAAVVMLAPKKESDDGENDDENEIVRRCRVDIVRL